jgi:redox-sensitive bicupin YhaK (pirin superfamily)
MEKLLLRKSEERGKADYGWLKARYSFSFARYYDEEFMSFRSLRVINEDRVSAATGFALHPHNDMEIITYVLSGVLTHEDNLGNREDIWAGSFQVMSAGSGIVHSEFNHGKEECHLLQIWIEPNQFNGKASYKIGEFEHEDKWRLIASGQGVGEVFHIKQNAELFAIHATKNLKISLPKTSYQTFWMQIAQGSIKIYDVELQQGDGFAFESKNEEIEIAADSRILLFAFA